MSEQPYKIWLDGKFIPWKEATVHVLTHTLHYGLGIFEGIRAYECHNGKTAIFRLADHVKRLFTSSHIAQIKIPYSQEEISKAITDVIIENELKKAYIRPLVFIGDGTLGVHPKKNPIRVAIAAYPWGAYLGDEGIEMGIRAKISSFIRMPVNSFMTKAKICGNYVNSALAKLEVTSLGFDEALMLDSEGYIAEGTGENIFIARNGVVKTPPLTSILEGITRESAIQILHGQGYEVVKERFTRDELYIADEVFLTGTAAEITPVREVDGRTIGNGKPGVITKNLQSRYFDIVVGKDPEFSSWLDYVG